MRRFTSAAGAAILGLVGWLAYAADPRPTPAGALPPLTVDKSAPLLLDEPGPEPAGAAKVAIERKLICHDCHGDFLRDSLSVTHARTNITCITCHGVSEAHSGDEENITPPQIMYAREDIAGKCRSCHKTHNAPAEAVLVRWQQRGLQALKPAELVCTDCHGEHRMKVRAVAWDKRTGKLLPKKPAAAK